MLGQMKMLVAHCLHANKFVSYIEWGEHMIYILLGDPERCWHAPILHCPVWVHRSCHALQVQSLPNIVHWWRCQQTVKNEYWWHQIYCMLTVLFHSALCSIRYVEDHQTFMSMISWTGLAIPPCPGTIISFIFSLQSYLFILSYQVTWLRSSTVLHHSIYQSANTWLVHAFHYYIIDPWSASHFTHVYLLVYIVGLVAYLSLSLILLESPPTSVSPCQ